MPPFIDPAPRARIATIGLAIYIGLQAVEMATTALASPDDMVEGVAAILVFIAMVGALVAVCFWVYRVNANAHTFAGGLSITPGWNVGWFFVPFGNLWKPFTGIRETWQASVDPHRLPDVPVPGTMRVWWGCWLIGNLVGNAAFRLGNQPATAAVGKAFDLASSAAMIAAGALLIGIIARLTPLQRRANAAAVFA